MQNTTPTTNPFPDVPLPAGAVERLVRVAFVGCDDALTIDQARNLSIALTAAADELDRLDD